MIDLRALCLKCNGTGHRFLNVDAIEAEPGINDDKKHSGCLEIPVYIRRIRARNRVRTICDVCGGRGFIR